MSIIFGNEGSNLDDIAYCLFDFYFPSNFSLEWIFQSFFLQILYTNVLKQISIYFLQLFVEVYSPYEHISKFEINIEIYAGNVTLTKSLFLIGLN